MQKITSIDFHIIFNSYGSRTIEAVLNRQFTASCPGGISKSSFESREVEPTAAIQNFSKVKKQFLGSFSQESFDALLKQNKNSLGSILTTALSLAFFTMDFDASKFSQFPNLLGNVLGGGEHSFGRGPEIQEMLVIPRAKTITESVETTILIWKELKEELKKRNALHGLNAESAWTTDFGNDKALELVKSIAERHNAEMGIDFAASSIFHNGRYRYKEHTLTPEKQIGYAESIAKNFGLIYMEDPLEENDFSGFAELRNRLKKTLVCGDDLISSSPERLKKAAKCINAVIVKPNQIGTISDCLELMSLARSSGISPAVSHRSTETCCTSTAKLALQADFAKFGVAGIHSEKRNELIRLWDAAKKPEMRKLPF